MPIALKAPANICTISENAVVEINLAPCHMMRDANVTDYMANAQISGLAQDSSISSANALEILQSCTKPLTCIAAVRICYFHLHQQCRRKMLGHVRHF